MLVTVFSVAGQKATQYTLLNDLTDFAVSPSVLLRQHPLWLWTVPTVLMMANDQSLTDAYQNNIDKRIAPLMTDHVLYDIPQVLFVLNMILEDTELRHLVYCLGETLTDSLFVAQGLKHVVGRSRPYLTQDGPYSWGHGGTEIFGPYTSFPSSHATIYSSFFSTMGKYFKNELLWDGVGVATFVSLSGHNHWISDMWFGYLLGKAISGYVWDKNSGKNLEQNWWIYPSLSRTPNDDLPMICVGAVF
ncbi:MAG: phosphatase PAP2 family protein [Candidatus Margulisiibacteriota bacterium]